MVGTHRTFLVFAIALTAVAAPGLGARRFLLVPLALGGLVVIPPAAIGADVPGAKVIFETETQYQYARVLQFGDGVRWLQLNEGVAVHSIYRPRRYLVGGYWDDFLVLPLAGVRGVPQRIAILGDAAGTVARAYGHYFPRTRVDAVELDGQLTTIGKRYFDLSGPRLHLYTADARPWLAASSTPAVVTIAHSPRRSPRRSASRPPIAYPADSATNTVAIVFAQMIVEAPK